MTTAWTLPTSISQYVETDAEHVHISWDDTSFDNLTSITGRALGTTNPLYHIARSPKHDLKTKTYFLKLGGFQFEDIPNIISGIEVRLTSKRYGRITRSTSFIFFLRSASPQHELKAYEIVALMAECFEFHTAIHKKSLTTMSL